MNGPGHAITGAAGGLWLSAWAAAAGQPRPPVVVAMFAVVSAAFALWSDLDHKGSTLARSLGPATWMLAWLVSFLSDVAQYATCRCRRCRDSNLQSHRTLTHTLMWVGVTGAGVWWAGREWELPFAAVVVGVSAGVVVLGLFGVRGNWLPAALLGTAVWWATRQWGGGVDWSWLGVAAGWGTLAHVLGDFPTKHATPLFAPFVKIKGCWWHPVGLPRPLRFTVGKKTEAVLFGLLVMAAVWAGWVLYRQQAQAAYTAVGGS